MSFIAHSSAFVDVLVGLFYLFRLKNYLLGRVLLVIVDGLVGWLGIQIPLHRCLLELKLLFLAVRYASLVVSAHSLSTLACLNQLDFQLLLINRHDLVFSHLLRHVLDGSRLALLLHFKILGVRDDVGLLNLPLLRLLLGGLRDDILWDLLRVVIHEVSWGRILLGGNGLRMIENV